MIINIPHPAAFALHKLLISSRRATEHKSLRDKSQAIDILNKLTQPNDVKTLKSIFKGMSQKNQKSIIEELTGNSKIVKIFT